MGEEKQERVASLGILHVRSRRPSLSLYRASSTLLTAFPIQTDIAGGLQHDNLPFYISEASITLGPSILFSWDLRPCVIVALVRRTHGNNRC